MSHEINTQNSYEIEVSATELAGLALAMRIVVTDYLSDRRLSKCNALDALASLLHARAEAHVQSITTLEVDADV